MLQAGLPDLHNTLAHLAPLPVVDNTSKTVSAFSFVQLHQDAPPVGFVIQICQQVQGRSVNQLGRNLVDVVGHHHFGRCRDAGSLGCSTELGRLGELAHPCRVLVFSKENEIVGFVGATEDPKCFQGITR